MRRGRQAEKLCGTVSESLLIHGPRGIISIKKDIRGQIPIAMAKKDTSTITFEYYEFEK